MAARVARLRPKIEELEPREAPTIGERRRGTLGRIMGARRATWELG
jgi:hypothetical protein